MTSEHFSLLGNERLDSGLRRSARDLCPVQHPGGPGTVAGGNTFCFWHNRVFKTLVQSSRKERRPPAT